VLRGTSKKLLWASSTGEFEQAVERLLVVHGEYRVPTLLGRVDQECRHATEDML
jgi:hypothetical protein